MGTQSPPAGAGRTSSEDDSPMNTTPADTDDMVAVDLSKPTATVASGGLPSGAESPLMPLPSPLLAAGPVTAAGSSPNHNNNNSIYKLPQGSLLQQPPGSSFPMTAQNLLPSTQPEVGAHYY